MEKLNIQLSGYNLSGVLAGVEDGNGYAIELVRWSGKKDPVGACEAAAARLRALADRFDALALERDPLKVATQNRINRRNC